MEGGAKFGKIIPFPRFWQTGGDSGNFRLQRYSFVMEITGSHAAQFLKLAPPQEPVNVSYLAWLMSQANQNRNSVLSPRFVRGWRVPNNRENDFVLPVGTLSVQIQIGFSLFSLGVKKVVATFGEITPLSRIWHTDGDGLIVLQKRDGYSALSTTSTIEILYSKLHNLHKH